MKSIIIALALASSASCLASAQTEPSKSEDLFDPAVEITRATASVKNDIIKGDASFKSIFITKIASAKTANEESKGVDEATPVNSSEELEVLSINDMYHVCGKVKRGDLLSKTPYRRFVYFSQGDRKLVSVDGDGQFTPVEFEKIWKGGCKIKKVKEGFLSETVYEEEKDLFEGDEQ